MKKITIFMVPLYDVPEAFKKHLEENYGDYDVFISNDRDEVLPQLKDTEILFTFKLDDEMLELAPNLKWVHSFSAGVDTMPLQKMKARGIILNNVKGMHKGHMSEYAIAAMINLARNWHLMFRNQIKGVWDRTIPQGEIYGATVGILGLGQIGCEIARKASLLGMRVIGADSSASPKDFVEKVYGANEIAKVFKESDYVINLLPSTPETKQMINKDYFNLMKETACFIHIGRGITVKEEDLVEALQNRRIRGMVSDVYLMEPLPQDSPLWRLDNVMMSPHICGDSTKYAEKAVEIIKHNLKVYMTNTGEMINLVDLDRGY
ncbi:Phosphoglycerate dehydrogenase [Natronincola peptidivorans]|uniref:Phosphoglycerate dehydrogenase n=1 Tax=Natronincola peptidivorans TaxID=426128 RepID=A0A1I0G8E9_9FIRM|nr:D-2-hydroxyacid dehydrogenase [Natronincola peptidivorans]SET66346.1 Phosphoglycerate dehydrogenase [Natronincola peptidivorans]